MSNIHKKIKTHLLKRRTNFTYLYFIFIFAIIAVGVINMLLQSNAQSYASEMPQFKYQDEKEVIEKNNKLFPRTKKEELLYEMIEKEGIELNPVEEQYIKNH